MSPTWRFIWRCIARIIQLSLADVECMHSHNNQAAEQLFATLVSRVICREAKIDERCEEDKLNQEKRVGSTVESFSMSDQPTKRAKSIRDIVRQRCIDTCKLQAIPIVPGTTEFDKVLKETFLGVAYEYIFFRYIFCLCWVCGNPVGKLALKGLVRPLRAL